MVWVVRPPCGGTSGRLGRRADPFPARFKGRRDGGVGLVERDRCLVHRARGGDIAPAEAGCLDHLDAGSGAVPLLEHGDALVGAAQPAGQVVADAELGLLRRIGAEVRVEGDQPFDLV